MNDNQEPPCECAGPSFCARYGIQMNAHAHSICSGQGCSPQKSELYRSKWRKLAEERGRRGLSVIIPTNPQPTTSQPRQPRNRQQAPQPTGPGTELKELLASIGLTPQGCRCESRVKQMNQWGIQGCRDNREYIINWLREEERKRGWGEKIKAGLLTVTTGLITELSPTDPLGSLVDIAISRAEKKQQRTT